MANISTYALPKKPRKMNESSSIYRGADRLQGIQESQTLAITKRVRVLQSEGIDIIGLTLGQPDFDTPRNIRDAGIEAINSGKTHYPPVSGIPELREAIASKFSRQNNLQFQKENIVVSTGAKQALVNIIMSLVNPGEEVILFAPYWVSYIAMVNMAEATPVVIPTSIEDNYMVSPEQLEAHITDKTRMIIFNSPSNPTGSMYSEKSIRNLASVLKKHPNIFMISDEIYEELSYDETHFSPGSIPEIAEQVITVNGVSKGFAMTGWRVGYIGAPLWISTLCERFQGQVTSGTSSISQWAALEAISGDQSSTGIMVESFKKRRDFMFAELSKIEGLKVKLPEGAFYFYPDFSNFFGRSTPAGQIINDIDDLCDYLLMEGKVAVIPGTAFGTKNHVRISYAYAQEKLVLACSRIRESLARLK